MYCISVWIAALTTWNMEALCSTVCIHWAQSGRRGRIVWFCRAGHAIRRRWLVPWLTRRDTDSAWNTTKGVRKSNKSSCRFRTFPGVLPHRPHRRLLRHGSCLVRNGCYSVLCCMTTRLNNGWKLCKPHVWPWLKEVTVNIIYNYNFQIVPDIIGKGFYFNTDVFNQLIKIH